MSSKKYKNYFQINESYFPAVNEDVIRTQPNVWKSYYPHETFIKLLNQTKSVLTNGQRMSIWVEGSYGTGKSHAVLTLQKILECNNDELKEYFTRYKSVLSNDLYNEFYNIKNQPKKILTVHRYGSSDVRNDKTLMEVVQESIISSLSKNNFNYKGQLGVKDAIINWLSDENNRKYFNNLIQAPEYKIKFGGASADDILENLKSFTSEKAIRDLIENISTVGEEKGIKPFVLKKEDLKTWILDVIKENDLKAIFFIWDEFSDYFNLNKGNLSGFQYLAEMSESHPFYFCIVTHKSDIFFEGSRDEERTKINGRFIAPHCYIELPDNMAFILTAHAMQKVDDPSINKEWLETVEALYDVTHESREQVKKTAKIGDNELKGVLPIHPYAALVLKHIASAFDSNQRSMFDFIKNDRGDEIKGFQWFINNYGPEDEEALLTVDMLWDFFYEKGKEQLPPQIRSILDVYSRTNSNDLMSKEKRVLKTLLLLQAINEKVGDTVELFIPNDKNIGLAFEGTEITKTNASSLAQSLVAKQIVFERPLGGGLKKYSALISNGSLEEVTKEKERLRKELRTDKLIEEGAFYDDFKLPRNIEIRYPNSSQNLLTFENIKMQVARLKADSDEHPNRLYVAYTFARNQEESNKIRTDIQTILNTGFEKIVFVDYSATYLNQDLFDSYIENMANCNYQKGKDMQQSKTYDKMAKEALRRWKYIIKASSPKVFTSDKPMGIICNNETEVFEFLKQFDNKFFPYALETHVNVIDNMYAANSLSQGAECGIQQETRGTFKSANDNTKLEKQLAEVWKQEEYWINKPNEIVSRIKNRVEDVIKAGFEKSTRVSISDIYEALTDEPFGFMPCNLVAFILGFVLKEYANDSYNWSDDLTTEPMSTDKLKEMIVEVIKQQQTPTPKYRDKYIVSMSPEQRRFNKATAFIFSIDETKCSSVENTRSQLRLSMNNFRFPIWTLKYLKVNTNCDFDTVCKAIDLYIDIANNSSQKISETDIALQLGKMFLEEKELESDLHDLFNKEKCTQGMHEYLKKYKDGKLIELAKSIGDTGEFITEISKKFSSDSNWVWNKETVDERINETIIEYEIVNESNKTIVKTASYNNCLIEWSKKCDNFKVAYLTIKSETPDLDDYLGYLYQIKKNGSIYDSDKKNFLTCLKDQSVAFKDFCNNQTTLLKKACSYYLNDLSDEDVSEIASRLFEVFSLENSEFILRIEKEVKDYKANKAKYKLTSLWKDKTDSLNPIEWSNKFNMPIMCMIPSNEQEMARKIFEVVNGQVTDKNSIEEALNYLQAFKYYAALKDEAQRNECFKRVMLKSYSVLINDLENIKNKIRERFPSVAPYYWLGNTAIEEYIQQYAYQIYNNGGSSKVFQTIDSMTPEQAKQYLKSLVKENMVIGIEIIKNK